MRYGCDLGARHRADAASLRFRVAAARPASRLPLRDSSSDVALFPFVPSMRRFTLQDNAFEHFFDEGLIEKVIRPIKSGKEASVHLVRANPRTTGETLAALKVFHPPDRRAFRDEGIYRDGEFI